MSLFNFFLFLIFFELLIFFFIKRYKKNFKWLLTNDDEYPNFDKKKFQLFKKYSFDEKLGWKQKLLGSGLNNINKKKYSRTLGNHRILSDKTKKKLISSFGDSYVYCNHSEDEFTWQEQISKKSKYNILNYGVANYGFDQALLKYKNTKLSEKTKIIIIGFVPETIIRIQTRWKHFIEFGNIHGFKPNFFIKNDKLFLKHNPITKKTSIKKLNSIIKNLKEEEIFYKKKFLKYKFSFPYTFSFIKNLYENSKIFSYLLLKDIFSIFDLNKKNLSIDESLFSLILRRNVRESHKLFNDQNSTNLLLKLILEFKKIALKRGHKPVLIVFPQPTDLKLKSFKNVKNFINLHKKDIDIIDLSNFINRKKINKYYLKDKYGGHFSVEGNKRISLIIKTNLEKILKKN